MCSFGCCDLGEGSWNLDIYVSNEIAVSKVTDYEKLAL